MNTIMKTGRSVDWTREKITTLTTPDVRQLRANAVRLNDPEIMERCDVVLGERPRGRGAGAKTKSAATKSTAPKGVARQPLKKKAPKPAKAA